MKRSRRNLRAFTTADHFLAGIFFFETYDALDLPEYDRAAAIAAMDRVTQNHRDVRLLEQFGRHVVSQHIYGLFTPGSLAGAYHWRYEADDPVYGDFIIGGTVTIVGST